LSTDLGAAARFFVLAAVLVAFFLLVAAMVFSGQSVCKC
jgi:hypothetical protein